MNIPKVQHPKQFEYPNLEKYPNILLRNILEDERAAEEEEREAQYYAEIADQDAEEAKNQ